MIEINKDIAMLVEECEGRNISKLEIRTVFKVALLDYKERHPIEYVSSCNLKREYATRIVRDYIWFNRGEKNEKN